MLFVLRRKKPSKAYIIKDGFEGALQEELFKLKVMPKNSISSHESYTLFWKVNNIMVWVIIIGGFLWDIM